MRPTNLRLTGAIFGLVIALIFLPTVLALAEDGRDFAGFFSVTDVVDAADEVIVSLSLEGLTRSMDGVVVENPRSDLEKLHRSFG